MFTYSPLAVTIVGPAADLCHPLSARWRASPSALRQREMATASLSRSWTRQRGRRCDIPSWTCLAAAPGRCAPLRRPGGCVPATGGALFGREGTSTVTALTRSGRAVRVQSADGGYPRRGESAGQPRSPRSDSERAGCGPPQGVGGPRPPAARQGPLTCCPRARGSLLPRVHVSWLLEAIQRYAREWNSVSVKQRIPARARGHAALLLSTWCCRVQRQDRL